jgi:putative DNA primase/helicase
MSSKKKKIIITNHYLAHVTSLYIMELMGPLRYWRRQYHYWVRSHYKKISDDEITVYMSHALNKKIRELEAEGFTYEFSKKFSFNAAFLLIKPICHISEEIELNTHITNVNLSLFLPTKSGVIDFSRLADSGPLSLMSFSQDFWTTRSIPHEIPDLYCAPTFDSFLIRILPDPVDRLIVQEIFGYCLLPDCRFQKAFVFFGEGANGKSVLLLILRLMLGEENVSALPLDAIDPTRTFTLAESVGKLANITEDLNDIDRVAEGILKMLIAGEPLTIERKHKDPFQYRFTAKQVHSANQFPRFNDKSDGILRRLVFLNFKEKLEPHEQREEFTQSTFWLNTGELPSVLLWAVEGLRRLLQNKAFTSSDNSSASKAAYKIESNPALGFINDYLVIEETAETASSEIYDAYADWAKNNGFKSLSSSSLTKELKRSFPKISLSTNPKAHAGKRTRFWKGVRLLSGFEDRRLTVVCQEEDSFKLF